MVVFISLSLPCLNPLILQVVEDHLPLLPVNNGPFPLKVFDNEAKRYEKCRREVNQAGDLPVTAAEGKALNVT